MSKRKKALPQLKRRDDVGFAEWLESHGDDAFAEWLKAMPEVKINTMVTLPVALTLSRHDWFLLAQGAARNGWSLTEAIEYMLRDRGDGLTEWMNCGFENGDEEEDRLSRRTA